MPDIGMNDSAFTEVLEIKVDTDSFAAGLAEMESLYNDFVARVGEDKAGEMVNVGGFKGIADAINSLTGQFQEFDASATTAMADMSEAVRASLDSIEIREAELAQARADRAAQFKRQREQAAEQGAGGGGSFFGDLAEDAVHLAKIALLWEAIGLALESVSKLVMAPFAAFGEGYEYAAKLQQKADELTGVLTANVKLTADMRDNFKAASDIAPEVVKALQNVAIKDNLPVDSLTNSFKALTEAGGARGVQTMNQLVQLTELFNLAMKASGVSAQTTRRLVSEIPLALNGVLPANSQWLKVLHMTEQEWESIRKEGLAHGNLLELLQPKLAPYLDAVQQAQLHHEVLNEQLDMFKQRWESLVAGPVFTQVNEWLSQIWEWLRKNQYEVEGWGTILGQLLGNLLKLAAPLENIAGPIGLKVLGFFSNWLLLAEKIASTIKYAVETTGNIASHPGLEGLQVLSKSGKHDYGGFADGASAKQYEIDFQHLKEQADFAKQQAVIDRMRAGNTQDFVPYDRQPGFIGPPVAGPLDRAIGDVGPHPAIGNNGDDPLVKIRAEMAEAISDAKSSASKAMSDVQTMERTGQIAAADAYQSRISILTNEQDAIDKAIQKYVHLAEVSGAKPGAIRKFAEQADKTGHNLDNTISTEENKAANTLTDDEFAAQKQQMQDDLKLAQDVSRQKIELAKLYGASATQVAQMEAQAEQQTYEKKFEILGAERVRLDQNSTQAQQLEREMAQLTIDHIYQVQDASKKAADARVADELRITKEGMAERMSALHSQEEEAAVLAQTSKNARTLWENNKALAAEYLHIVDSTLLSLKAQLSKAEANGVETASTQKLRQEIASLSAERAKADSAVKRTAQVPGIGAITNHDNAMKTAKDFQGEKQKNYDEALDKFAVALATHSPDVVKFGQSVSDAKTELDMAKQAVADLSGSFEQVGEKLADAIFGSGFFQKMQSADTLWDKFKVGIDGAVNALGNIDGIINQFQQGSKKGGVAGGIGSLLSSGPLSEALQSIPVVGQFIPAIGGALSFIGSMFTKAAQEIADKIQKAFDTTMKNYNNGNQTLSQTLTQVEQERTDAITKLSGQKGGKDQLNKLLPELDNEIAQLKKQQKDLITNFETQLKYLELQSGTLGTLAQQWDAINKSIKDYLDAGGSATNALLYAQLSLAQMQQTATDSLNQGQQTAIQDAIQLNDLLQQRVDLEKQYAQQVFGLENADSVERRGTGAVTRGQQVAQATADYQKQLAALNEQLGLTSQKVAMESQIFTLATNINDLHRQDDALTLLALDQQLQKYKDLQTFLSGSLVTNANGSYGVQMGNGQGFNVQTLQINVNPGTNASPHDIANAVSDEISRLGRQGLYDRNLN